MDDGRVPLEQARRAADEAIEALAECCERIEVAGSIRRGRETVKDIEIVAIPKVERVVIDLFGERVAERDLLDERVRALRDAGVISDRPDSAGRPSFGRRAKRIRWRGMALDLFAVLPPAQWGVLLAIRTGSAEFATRFMTARRLGGLLPDDMLIRNGCLYHAPGVRIPVESEARRNFPQERLQQVPLVEEAEFFAALGMDWVAPEHRH